MSSKRRIITVGSGRTKETMDTYGHNPQPEPEWMKHMPVESEPVPHEDVDTDEQRLRHNNHRNSSYKR